MEKIRFITDTASDIPEELLREHGIVMLGIPIAVDGEGYFERESFTIQEFYDVLEGAKEIPTTSRIPMDDYVREYQRAFDEGCGHVINVTINAGGSGIYTAAILARDMFYEKCPQAREAMPVHVVDSGTYTMAYGWPVVEGAKMAKEGKSAAEILDYLEDWFSRVQIYLGCYTLEYAKKSGRVGAAAAFVGDVLGLRPVILMEDGETRTIDKVRGDKNLAPHIFAAYQGSRQSPEDPVLVIRSRPEEPPAELQEMIEADTGRRPEVFWAGASIVINAGPRVVAIVSLGERREQGRHCAGAR